MHPHKVDRQHLAALTDLTNIGKSIAADLRLLGINTPSQLVGQCPFDLHARLCAQTAMRHDPCVIDVFMSVTRFMAGDAPQPWWAYTAQRKRHVAATGAVG